MIRVTQHERGIDLLEMFGRESLDCRLRANRREDRGEELAVRCGEDARTSAVIFGRDLEVEHRADYKRKLRARVFSFLLCFVVTKQIFIPVLFYKPLYSVGWRRAGNHTVYQ